MQIKHFSVPLMMAVAMSLSGSILTAAEEADAQVKLAREYFLNGKFNECISVLEREPEDRRNAEALNMMGGSLAKLSKDQEAERNFRAAITRYPNHLAAYFNLGQFYLERQSPTKAITVLQAGLKVFPKSDRLLRALGTAYQVSGNLRYAQATFERWVQLDSKSNEAYAMLGDSYLEAGDYGPAVVNLRSAADRSPRDARIQYLLALAYSYLGQIKESQACLQRTLELDPGFCMAFYQLAKGELDRNNDPQAFEFLKKAVACNPAQAQPYYQLSRIYSRRGESALADQEMQLFLKYRLPTSAKGMVSATEP
jgi:tetratricopeptide (TPR) repeat protein